VGAEHRDEDEIVVPILDAMSDDELRLVGDGIRATDLELDRDSVSARARQEHVDAWGEPEPSGLSLVEQRCLAEHRPSRWPQALELLGEVACEMTHYERVPVTDQL
jgi:hypothetical protein